MIKTHTIEYDFSPLATVEIDESKATKIIKEMVEFWMGWEDAVENNDGDYTKSWLQNLALFIIKHGQLPHDEEGWCELDGEHGINVKSWHAWEPDRDAISIE